MLCGILQPGGQDHAPTERFKFEGPKGFPGCSHLLDAAVAGDALAHDEKSNNVRPPSPSAPRGKGAVVAARCVGTN